MDNNIFVAIKAAIVTACTAFSAAFGWLGWLVVAWVGCMAADYITGTCSACKQGNWSSAVARDGLWHKAGMIFAVIAAGVLDMVVGLLLDEMPGLLPFEYTALVAPIVICWYIFTELGSIVENAGNMGAPVPPVLQKMIAVLSAHLDSTEPMGDDKDAEGSRQS